MQTAKIEDLTNKQTNELFIGNFADRVAYLYAKLYLGIKYKYIFYVFGCISVHILFIDLFFHFYLFFFLG